MVYKIHRPTSFHFSSFLTRCIAGCAVFLALDSWAGSAVSLVQVKPSDSHETIIQKAAHVVPSQRQLDYLRREYVAFIHWGPNTFSKREWGTGKEDPALFNPTDLDTDQWCRTLKAAGMQMVVVVVKHHDGYCLWQTRYTSHGVMASPWRDGHGDVLRELAQSCKKWELNLGVYLSPADLFQIESPEGLYGNGSSYTRRTIPRTVKGRPFKNRRTFHFKVDDYNEYFLNQLFELLTEYGPIHEVWFDGANPKHKGGQTYAYAHWYALIRTLAPEAVIFGKGPDVRWCGNEGGGTRKAEWNVIPLETPPERCEWPDLAAEDLGSREKLYSAKYLYYLPAEVNTSIRAGWFYRDERQAVRSAEDIFDIYERAVGGNAVFMLNVPPDCSGHLGLRDVASLEASGRRIRATYGTNLLDGARASAREVLDGNPKTFWQPTALPAALEIRMAKPQAINRVVLQEAIARHGQRIEAVEVDGWIDNRWVPLAQAETVGYKRILRFPTLSTSRLRVRISKARLNPTLAEVSAHCNSPSSIPVEVRRDASNRILLECASAEKGFSWKRKYTVEPVEPPRIFHTLNGTDPDIHSEEYTQPLDLPQGGELRYRSMNGIKMGPVSTLWIGIRPKKTSVSGLEFDLGAEHTVGGFSYLPKPHSRIEVWRFETSDDGKTWMPFSAGTFGNLMNDPSLRVHHFSKHVTARHVRLINSTPPESDLHNAPAEIKILPAVPGSNASSLSNRTEE